MPLNIQDFKEPTEHPFGMLEGYQRAFEKESVLMLILLANVKAGKFEPVKTRYTHPTMVEDGLLEEIGGGVFSYAQGYRTTVLGLPQRRP